MSIEVLPLGYKCNIGCTYCYQDPVRHAGNATEGTYDIDAMKRTLLEEGYRFSLFGGEPLLVPVADLEELWRWGLETFGQRVRDQQPGTRVNAIQTNATLMTDEHVRLFKQYNVGVGISLDGPGELNDARWVGTEARTREATARSEAALRRLLAEGLGPSLIVTLTRVNASADRLPRLVAWLRDLARRGLQHVNLHLLEVNSAETRETLSLTDEENATALLTVYRRTGLSVSTVNDMRRLLRGEDSWSPHPKTGKMMHGAGCTWNACDPYTTDAVHGVDGQGVRHNCGRTAKDGVNWVKADRAGFERYLALYYAPQHAGGCRGCRFFYACKGQCPGTAEGGDWRGRTEHCETFKQVFTALEEEMLARGETPVSLTARRMEIEQYLLDGWARGQYAAVGVEHGDTPHGDHEDAIHPVITHEDHHDADTA